MHVDLWQQHNVYVLCLVTWNTQSTGVSQVKKFQMQAFGTVIVCKHMVFTPFQVSIYNYFIITIMYILQENKMNLLNITLQEFDLGKSNEDVFSSSKMFDNYFFFWLI